MQQLNYTIVGFRHHAWQGATLDERLRSARGKRVVLMHEETNGWNVEATAVYIDTELVGYVSNDECHETTAYCDQSTEQLLYGSVTHVDVEHHRALATVSVAEGLTVGASTADAAYAAWEQQCESVPTMGCTRDELRLRMLQRDLTVLLSADEGLDDTLRHDLEAYEWLMLSDLSREATLGRRRIVQLMGHSRHADVRAWGQRLAVSMTAMGSPETRERLAVYLCTELPATELFRDLAARHAQTDLALLEQQLAAFPHGLYDEFRVSPVTFVSKLYYRMVPAAPLRRFLSGLLLAEQLRGRLTATVKQSAALRDALDYVAQIDHCAAERWQGLTDRLWQRIADLYAPRIVQTNGARATTFNRRFVCQLVGTLLSLGVYRQDVAQTEYTCLLEGNRKSSLRKNINQGVDDDGTRLSLRQLLSAING